MSVRVIFGGKENSASGFCSNTHTHTHTHARGTCQGGRGYDTKRESKGVSSVDPHH